MYVKLTYFLHHNLILFWQNYKKQAQVFYQNRSLVLHMVEIFCNLILRNRWAWNWKISDCFTELVLTLWYWTWTRKILEISYCVCLKRTKLCYCLCSSSSFSCFSTCVIRNIGEFGTKNYFIDHQIANTIHGFRDSVPVLRGYGGNREYVCLPFSEKRGKQKIGDWFWNSRAEKVDKKWGHLSSFHASFLSYGP